MADVHLVTQIPEALAEPTFPSFISIIANHLGVSPAAHFLHYWETTIFSVIAIGILTVLSYLATRRMKMVPGRVQTMAEVFVSGVDDFVCSVIGPRGRQLTPFIGTLFIYILLMNYMGLVPFFHSPTANWSTTLGLGLIVFVYVQFMAFKELGFFGVFDHMMGKPRGFLALSGILPLFMFALHFMGELIRPLSLSLRLRSNVWGDDMLLATLAGFGWKGIPLLFMNEVLVLVAATVQAGVFALLTLIYFSIVMVHDEDHVKTN